MSIKGLGVVILTRVISVTVVNMVGNNFLSDKSTREMLDCKLNPERPSPKRMGALLKSCAFFSATKSMKIVLWSNGASVICLQTIPRTYYRETGPHRGDNWLFGPVPWELGSLPPALTVDPLTWLGQFLFKGIEYVCFPNCSQLFKWFVFFNLKNLTQTIWAVYLE